MLKMLSFMRFCVLFVGLCACVPGVLLRKSFPVPVLSKLLLIFSPVRLRVSNFTLKSLIHLELRFVQVDKQGSVSFFLSASLISIICGRCCLPVCVSGFFIKNQVSAGVWSYVCVFISITLINMSVLYQYCAVFITAALQHNLLCGTVIPPAIPSSFSIISAIKL